MRPANLMLGVTLRWTRIASHPGGVEIFLVTSCYRNRDKLQPDEPLGRSIRAARSGVKLSNLFKVANSHYLPG